MKTFVTRFAILSGVVILASLTLSGPVSGQNAGSDVVPTATFEPERLTATGAIVYGSATMLVRTRDDVTATVHTTGLTPGNVYTAWFAIFNDPRYCATQPCSPADLSNPLVQGSLLGFGGRIVGADGVADYAEVRAVGDTTNAQIAGPGLQDTRRAQIHLAVRNHGAAALDPNVLRQQLTTFNGGCPPNACVTVQAAVHRP
jgi:hypothetical protein